MILFYFTISREMPLSELKDKYRKISSLEKARSCWENEYQVSSKQVRDTCALLLQCHSNVLSG